jgi:hypothetical protein
LRSTFCKTNPFRFSLETAWVCSLLDFLAEGFVESVEYVALVRADDGVARGEAVFGGVDSRFGWSSHGDFLTNEIFCFSESPQNSNVAWEIGDSSLQLL